MKRWSWTLHEGHVARREGSWPAPPKAPLAGTGISPATLQQTRLTCCESRSNALPGSPWAKLPQKWRRRLAPSCTHSRSGTMVQVFRLVADSLPTPGTVMDQANSYKTWSVCHVSSVEDEPGVGGGGRHRQFSSPTQRHGARQDVLSKWLRINPLTDSPQDYPRPPCGAAGRC